MKDINPKQPLEVEDTASGEDINPEETRRKALRSLIVSSAVAGTAVSALGWKKPFVRSVILPAHAKSTPNPNSDSLEDPCILDLQCIEGGIRVNGSGQVTGTGNLNNIAIRLDVTFDGETVTRNTTTSANGQWTVAPIEFTTTDETGTVSGTVSSPLDLFPPGSCEADFDCSGGDDSCDKCDSPTFYRLKWDTEDGGSWDSGTGRNDCIQQIPGGGSDTSGASFASGSQVDVADDDDVETTSVTITLTRDDCWIVTAIHKAGNESAGVDPCIDGAIANDCQSAEFTANPKSISHAELIIACCES